MIQISIQRLAQEILQELFDKNQKQYGKIEKAINELAQKGLFASNVKKLTGTKNIFRKRVGRWRILFTVENEIFKIWIIAIEKGTRQDYLKWIFYIQRT
ncbi:type II toxin-antitoxin system RelE/ParE family toxin [Candidatus Peregrinibacteria bacterium]|nr:type II toxin-antitoxin system RelE/ParE family toxin [Candidatus Peregrinibacteria bacterium]